MKKACVVWLVLWGFPINIVAQEQHGDAERDVAQALAEEGLRKNQGLRAIEKRIAALSENIDRAGAWMDPIASAEYSNIPIDSLRPDRHPMSGVQFKLQQTFFFPGKTSRREAVAKGEVKQAKEALAESQTQLRNLVKRAYYELTLVRQLREITKEHIQLVAQFIDVVRVKYEVGKTAQHELIRLEVLRGELSDQLEDFDRDDQALSAEINSTLHRPNTVPIQTPKTLAALEPQSTLAKLIQHSKHHRPLLRQYREQARTKELAAKQASLEGYPDFTAWLSYRLRSDTGADPGTDFVGAGLSVPIPFWYDQRWGSERRINENLAREARAQEDALFDDIRAKLADTVSRWKRAYEQTQTYEKQLTPQSKQALEATFSAYQVDRADFASLYQAELQLLDFERTLRRARALTHISQAQTEALIGSPLKTKQNKRSR
ncbi:MAG: TolC family protein [Myxococcales bacterium]|nr:MAG: TolC family protein [Myxococcales bacterium]